MSPHVMDKKRQLNPTPPFSPAYRLLGVNSEGRPFFYWSREKGKLAAYVGPSKPYGVWGTLECRSGKRMLAKHRVFIADTETAEKLEQLRVVGPCGNCNKAEYARYSADGSLMVDRKVIIE